MQNSGNKFYDNSNFNNFNMGNNSFKNYLDKLLNKMEIVGNNMNNMNERLEKLESQVSSLYKERNQKNNNINQINNDNILNNDIHDNNINDEGFINENENNIIDEEEEKKMELKENLENAENLKDTMKYYQEKFNVKNVFEENLQPDNLNRNLNNNEKVPVEIFEDIGNHLEDFEKEIISPKKEDNIKK
jgi:hypothetical protein